MSFSRPKHESNRAAGRHLPATPVPHAGIVAPLGLQARNRGRNEGRMSSSVASSTDWSARGPLIPTLFFICPLFTAAAPRLAPFFLPLIAVVLIGAALRRGLPWRELLRPNAALAALIAVALFASLSALWAADPKLAV